MQHAHFKARNLVGLLALILAACGTGEPPHDDTNVLHRGNKSEPLTLDPHVAHLQDARFIIAEMFTGLYEPGPAGEPQLALAESVDVSGDGLTWTFVLRDALWSDGQPITSDDVVAGLRRTIDPATLNPYPSTFFMLENAAAVNRGDRPVESLGARALDTRTVELKLAHPAPYLPSLLMLWGQPVPRHALAEHGPNWMRPENIVTSGPYHLVEWRTEEFVHLRASETFFEASSVCLEEVYFYPTTDTASAERRVRNGELHLNTEFSSANLEFLQRRNPELVRVSPGLIMRNLTLNTAEPPFDDARVRRALSLATDRRFLTEAVLAGADAPALRAVAESISGRAEDVELDFADEDIESRRIEARTLLQEAGYGPGNPLAFTLFLTPSAGWPRVAPVLQADWGAIAPWVKVELLVRDTQLHYAGMRAGAFEAGTAGWLPDFDDPYAYLLQWEGRASDINYSRWSDPLYDALVEEAIHAAGPERRAELMGQAEQIMLDAAPMIPVFFDANKMLVRPEVEGFVPNAYRLHPSRWLCLADPA